MVISKLLILIFSYRPYFNFQRQRQNFDCCRLQRLNWWQRKILERCCRCYRHTPTREAILLALGRRHLPLWLRNHDGLLFSQARYGRNGSFCCRFVHCKTIRRRALDFVFIHRRSSERKQRREMRRHFQEQSRTIRQGLCAYLEYWWPNQSLRFSSIHAILRVRDLLRRKKSRWRRFKHENRSQRLVERRSLLGKPRQAQIRHHYAKSWQDEQRPP